MPAWLLRQRAAELREFMDDPNCDQERLENTYHGFRHVNRFVSAWRRIYRREIVPRRPQTLLDIGFGGGDIAISIAQWAAADGLDLSITAIDSDPRALDYVSTACPGAPVEFVGATTKLLMRSGAKFDVVISNHLLHHLTQAELLELCGESKALATQLVIHNDIRRDDVALAGFSLTAPFFPRSFITRDGLRSIRRSFTDAELRAALTDDWTVERRFPFRNVLINRR